MNLEIDVDRVNCIESVFFGYPALLFVSGVIVLCLLLRAQFSYGIKDILLTLCGLKRPRMTWPMYVTLAIAILGSSAVSVILIERNC